WSCVSCLGWPVFCIACCKDVYMMNPFHQVEQWTGEFFTPPWLWQVGVSLHLGHRGDPCP
ncbi:hypothetical protein JAAARDRAFT_114172, partial [Jaapia argillacea MUCL 33604]